MTDTVNGDVLTDYRVSCVFVGHFWKAAQEGDKSAWAMVAGVQPEYLLYPDLRAFYELVQHRFAAGEGLDPVTVGSAMREKQIAPDTLRKVELARREQGVHTNEVISAIATGWQRHEATEMLRAAAKYLAAGKGKGGGKKMIDALTLKLMGLYYQNEKQGGYKSKEQLIAELKEEHMSDKVSGVPYWLPKMEKLVGPALPGEVVAWCGYSGTGKTVWSSNGFREFAVRGMPQICFPTESRMAFLDRVAAQYAGAKAAHHGGLAVETWRAQKRRWQGAEAQRDVHFQALDEFQALNWLVVDRSEITPEEIQLAVRILRRQWPGQHVMVWVDHMHRLDYGSEEADEQAGVWTRKFKNMATEDPEGLTFQLLFQPRKPGAGEETYRPVLPQEIRGHSSVWNECDTYVSPFRCHVMTDQTMDPNPWGSYRTKRDPGTGSPVVAKRKDKLESSEYKLSDEDAHLYIGKRRIGGEVSAPVDFRYENASGRIYEHASYTPGDEDWNG